MKRLLVLTVALMAAGCATGVEDPQAPPPEPTKEHAPPVQTFSAAVDDSKITDPDKLRPDLSAPKPDLEFNRPVPTNGDETIDPNVEVDLKK